MWPRLGTFSVVVVVIKLKFMVAIESGELSALDAVEECIKIMEDDPTFDAGKVCQIQ